MNRSSKIYVAGHTGLVGSAITGNLKSGGYDNLIFRTFNELDLTDQQAVEEFFSAEKPEYVFLAAALVGGIVANNTYRADFIYNNLMIQNNVIHACWKHGVKKLLFLGSTCIYPKNAPQPLKEEYLLTAPLEYTNEPYAIAKIAGLKTCESYNIQYGTDFIAVMPTNLYGPGDNYNLEKSHVLPALMRKIHLGKCFEEGNTDAVRKDLKKYPVEGLGEDSGDEEIISVLGQYGVEVRSGFENGTGPGAGKRVVVSVWGTGAPYREFMHSGDMARACIYIMEKVSATDIVNLHRTGRENDYKAPHFINIGTGEEITIRELAYRIKEMTGFRGEIVFDSSRPDGTMRKATDITILKNLGFRHRYDLDAGLREVYEKYLRDQNKPE